MLGISDGITLSLFEGTTLSPSDGASLGIYDGILLGKSDGARLGTYEDTALGTTEWACSRVRWFKKRDFNSNFPVALN